MEDGVEIINGQRFVRRFITERTDPYFLKLKQGCEQIEAARLEAEATRRRAEAARLAAEAAVPHWKSIQDGVQVMSMPEPAGSILYIHGIATTPTINDHNYSLESAGMDAALPTPLLSSHEGHASPLGSVFYIRRTAREVYVRAALFDNTAARYAKDLIVSGKLRCFSGASKAESMKLQGVVNGTRFYSAWTLREVSICQNGANPDCHFEVWRKGDDGKKFWGSLSKRLSPSKLTPALAEANGLRYRGPWSADEQYQPGDFASFQGGLWHSEISSKGLRPNESPAGWKLAVKRGAVERMEKAHASTSI
ncbi:MAG: hypothetical protein E5V62_19045 [Mesorhizobium sp.]|uniref:hypothetical protein n=1 Tax=Mesorhizobium sp. TaxID=1871066 RepID=UPI000FD2B53E|nr:hypothetical protein [Mesorhizobium sp.]RVD68417.1 hypothetical protein EN751_31520 [Mesorhizobium sp. M4A.F.Ca.ET.029.04.2.1]TIW33768.1 MAG: hypothetical protein E5V62_19045 [Mesorhizobium sp.]